MQLRLNHSVIQSQQKKEISVSNRWTVQTPVLHCTAREPLAAPGGLKCGPWLASDNTQMWKHPIIICPTYDQTDPMVSNSCYNVKHKSNKTTSVNGRMQTILLAAQLTTEKKSVWVVGPNSSYYGVLQAVWRLAHWCFISKNGPPLKKKQVKSFNTAHMVKQMSTLMLKYAIYAFSVEKQLKSVLNIWNVKILLLLW